MDIDGDLSVGPKHVFSLNSGDITNPVYKIVDNNGDQIVVHDSFINDAEAGDTRISRKTVIRANPASQDGLSRHSPDSIIRIEYFPSRYYSKRRASSVVC